MTAFLCAIASSRELSIRIDSRRADYCEMLVLQKIAGRGNLKCVPSLSLCDEHTVIPHVANPLELFKTEKCEGRKMQAIPGRRSASSLFFCPEIFLS